MRHRQQAKVRGVQVGQADGQDAAQTQGHTNGHTGQHQHHETDEEQSTDHVEPRRRLKRCNARVQTTPQKMGSHTEYHHLGTPMAGEVSS